MSSEPDSVRKNSKAYHKALTSQFTERTRQTPSNTIHAQAYQYQHLQDPRAYIRLLYLLPKSCVNGDHEGMLQCELMTFRVDEAPGYAGLSYTWGDPTPCRQIAVGRNILRITQSLANALEHLQEQDKTIVLWVDAICINQGNNAEKSAQVQMMGKIYMSASVVLVWLGPSNDESETAIERITKLDMSELLNTFSHNSAVQFKTLYPLNVIRAFLDRPWFNRVWVMQEVALNTEVIFVCGASDFARKPLLRAMLFATSALNQAAQEFRPFHFMRFATLKPMPLVQFIDSASTKSALWYGYCLRSSEPRDFVFSLFGMISDTEKYQLKVDYSKTIEEIYTDFMVAVVEATGLTHLANLWCRSSKYVELPSWVLDWSATSSIFIPFTPWIHGKKATVHLTNQGNRLLRTYVLRIDEIKTVECGHLGEDFNSVISQEEARRFLDKLSNTIARFPNIYKLEAMDNIVYDMSIAYSRSSMCERNGETNGLRNSYLALRGFAKAPENIQDTATWQAEASVLYLSALQLSRNNQYNFTTSNGIVGLTAHKVEVGDSLFLIHDTTGFWIIRETEPGKYRLISLATTSGYKHPADIEERVEVIDIY